MQLLWRMLNPLLAQEVKQGLAQEAKRVLAQKAKQSLAEKVTKIYPAFNESRDSPCIWRYSNCWVPSAKYVQTVH